MKTGQKIRHIRLAKKLTLAEVENAAGIANGNLSRIERGDQWISEDKLHTLAAALGVTVAIFSRGKFDLTPPG
jgi:transcriptional regulator with XRE-family HTH domain